MAIGCGCSQLCDERQPKEMTTRQSRPGDPDATEFPPEEREPYAVSSSHGLVCERCGTREAYWEPADWAWCCANCGGNTMVEWKLR